MFFFNKLSCSTLQKKTMKLQNCRLADIMKKYCLLLPSLLIFQIQNGEAVAINSTYLYDDMNRLTSASYSSGLNPAYSYDSAGNIDREFTLPAELVTCLTFGGKQMDEVFITTAWWGFSKEKRATQPQAGDIFRMKVDVKGLEEHSFAG